MCVFDVCDMIMMSTSEDKMRSENKEVLAVFVVEGGGVEFVVMHVNVQHVF